MILIIHKEYRILVDCRCLYMVLYADSSSKCIVLFLCPVLYSNVSLFLSDKLYTFLSADIFMHKCRLQSMSLSIFEYAEYVAVNVHLCILHCPWIGLCSSTTTKVSKRWHKTTCHIITLAENNCWCYLWFSREIKSFDIRREKYFLCGIRKYIIFVHQLESGEYQIKKYQVPVWEAFVLKNYISFVKN